MAESWKWVCPHCSLPQVVTTHSFDEGLVKLAVGKNRWDTVGLSYSATACANPDCGDVTVEISLLVGSQNYDLNRFSFRNSLPLQHQRVRPLGVSKPQPEYIPTPLRADYEQACLICDLSAKAAATLARRCLQGMIRDFCGIAKSRLVDEIDELRARVAAGTGPAGVLAESVEAIDHVRSIGNIGAHMEKDINLVIDVDPGEAQILIELVEMLFSEWYVARRKREDRLTAVKQIADDKRAQKLLATK